MNVVPLAHNATDMEVNKKHKATVSRLAALVLGIVAIIAVGLLVTSPGSNTTVWVHFLGRRLVVAHGGVPATVAPVLLLLVGVLIPAGALINAVRTPRSAFNAIGRSKVRWIVSMLVLFLIGDASFLIVPLYYLLRVRPQLRRQRADAFV